MDLLYLIMKKATVDIRMNITGHNTSQTLHTDNLEPTQDWVTCKKDGSSMPATNDPLSASNRKPTHFHLDPCLGFFISYNPSVTHMSNKL